MKKTTWIAVVIGILAWPHSLFAACPANHFGLSLGQPIDTTKKAVLASGDFRLVDEAFNQRHQVGHSYYSNDVWKTETLSRADNRLLARWVTPEGRQRLKQAAANNPQLAQSVERLSALPPRRDYKRIDLVNDGSRLVGVIVDFNFVERQGLAYSQQNESAEKLSDWAWERFCADVTLDRYGRYYSPELLCIDSRGSNTAKQIEVKILRQGDCVYHLTVGSVGARESLTGAGRR